LLNEELLFLGFLHYDLHDLRLVLFFLRRDHDERHYERLLPRHGVDALRHLVLPDGDGNTVHCRAHCDRLGADGA
jgi:hypothetical protein